ncbi:hypothetical protein PVNG_05007 [Plasmodium vivax North Korean]|uniref:VIR protein n=1 Tax=Plasmodium vivax North Korean TaxID=1035514 RepID=A0A0J9TZY7_PLAVI|nr:hypothetical protein PVNG_05007 [Plasmodium vivax North Korean]
MSNDPLKPEYFDYNLYAKVKKKFKNSEYNQPDNERFKKITDKISNLPRELKWNDKIFTILHKYLAVYNGYELNVNQCCRYINFWLNKEVRGRENEKYRQHFDIFQDFSHKFAFENQGRYDDSCKEYIHYMNENDYNRMKLLYDFFDMYINLNSEYNRDREEACKNLLSSANTYNDAIDNYYDHHRDIFYKIRYVKDLIDKIIKNPDSECKQNVHFRKPKTLIEEERQKELARIAEERKKQEDAERQRQEANETERRRREAEAAKRQSTQQIQQELVPQRGIPQMHTSHDAHREIFQQGESRSSVELENPGETLHLEEQDPSNLLRHRLRLSNSGTYEDSQEPALGKLYDDQLGKRFHKQENEDTRTEGSYLDHSLEEEEDESIKFLELLEDFHQENSQIFKIMKVGILDMV